LKLTTDGYKALRGLSATTELYLLYDECLCSNRCEDVVVVLCNSTACYCRRRCCCCCCTGIWWRQCLWLVVCWHVVMTTSNLTDHPRRQCISSYVTKPTNNLPSFAPSLLLTIQVSALIQGVSKSSPLKLFGIFSLLFSLFAWTFAELLAIRFQPVKFWLLSIQEENENAVVEWRHFFIIMSFPWVPIVFTLSSFERRLARRAHRAGRRPARIAVA